MIVLLVLAGTCVGLFYLALVGMVLRPQVSLYAYLLLWVLVPKGFRLFYLTGGAYDFPDGVTVFNVLEGMVVLGILVAMLLRPREHPVSRHARTFAKLSVLFAVSGVLGFILSLGFASPLLPTRVNGLWSFLADSVPMQYRVLPVLSLVYGAIFVLGCVRFIRTLKDTEPFFWIVAFSGVEIAFERVALVNLQLFQPATRLAVEKTGRFNSLMFTNYDIAGIFAVLAVCGSLYLALKGRKLGWATFAAAWVPIVFSYQRSVLLGAVAGTVFVFLWKATSQSKIIVTAALIAIGSLAMWTGVDKRASDSLGRSLGGSVRPTYFSTETLAGRVALWRRSFDVIRFTMPLGTGPDMASWAMNYSIPGEARFDETWLQVYYEQIAAGFRNTNTHNVYIQFVVEHGAAGAILLGAYFVFLAGLVKARIRRPADEEEQDRFSRLVQACSFAMLIGIGLHGLFETTQIPAFVYAFPCYILIVAISSQSVARSASPLPDRELVSARS